MRAFRNPIVGGGDSDDRGDPFVMKWLGRYYLYHSGETSGPKGVSVYTSETLVDWEFAGFALVGEGGTGRAHDLWAPEVVYADGMFYMYVAATKADLERRTRHPLRDLLEVEIDLVSEEDERRIYVATASDPLGPFRFVESPLVDGWAIDGHVFRSDGGEWWFFYNARSGDVFGGDALAGTRIVADRMRSPTALERRPLDVVAPSEPWEADAKRRFYWNEAPTVLARRERLYVMYSGGFFWDASYGVGVASASSVLGTWTKHPLNPILRSGRRIGGPGHHSVTTAPDGATPYAVYHGYCAGDRGRKIHAEELFWSGDRPAFRRRVPAEGEQVLPDEPWFDPSVPWWRAELWVDGSFTIGDAAFEHPRGRAALVEVELRPDGLTVRKDRRTISACGPVEPRFGGAILDERLTSYLDDTREVGIEPRGTHVVPWGAPGRFQVSVAAKGAGEVAAGRERVEFDHEGFRLLVFRCRDVSDVVITAGAEGATVADLTIRRTG